MNLRRKKSPAVSKIVPPSAEKIAVIAALTDALNAVSHIEEARRIIKRLLRKAEEVL